MPSMWTALSDRDYYGYDEPEIEEDDFESEPEQEEREIDEQLDFESLCCTEPVL